MKIQNSQFPSIEQLQDQYLNQTKVTTGSKTESGLSFEDIFKQKARETSTTDTEDTEVKFSKHASSRLIDRNIELTGEQLERLNAGTQKASEKGINESLVLMDQLAFIVNVPSNTVITAMDQTETNENVFTNIDGAVIV